MRNILVQALLLGTLACAALAAPLRSGSASWYGEEHRGKLMADGQPFNPDKLTAASWLYPLGTKVRVTASGSTNAVEVTITDRGPGRKYREQGRIIDLTQAAFARLAPLDRGLIQVTVLDLAR